MVCKNCGQECTDDMFFCTNCGEELSKDVQEAVEVATDAQVEAVTEAVEEVVEVAQEEAVAKTEEVKETVEETVAEAEEVKETVEETVAEAEEVAAEIEEAKEVVKEEEGKKEKKANEPNLVEGKNSKKPIAIGLALVAILLLIFVPVVAMNSGDDPYMRISEQSFFKIEERDGDWYIFYTNGKEIKLDDEPTHIKEYGMDEAVVCYINEDDELVIVKDGKQIKTGIDEPKGLVLSQKGDMLAYFVDCESATYTDAYYGYSDYKNVGTLCLYDIKKKSSMEIAEEAVVGSAVLSPDGKTVAYVAEYDATDDFRGFYSVNGKEPEEVGKEKRVFAISDKGKYVYYMDVDRIYVAKKGEEEKLAGDIYDVEVMMNADNTEMLFINDGKTYITVKGGEKKKVAGDKLDWMIVESDVAYYDQELSTERGSIEVSYTCVDTFKEKLFYSNADDDIYYMLKGFDAEKVASNVYDYAVADDGKSLIYDNYSDIIKVTKFDKGGEKEIIAADAQADGIYADGDLKHVYLINDDDELYYVNKGKGKKIADDVTDAMISMDGDYCYYIVDDEEFCYSKKGGKEKELLTLDDGGMSCLNEGGMSLLATYDDGVSTVYRMEGSKMTVIYELEED